LLRDPSALIDVRLGVRAQQADLAAGRVELTDGSSEAFDHLVAATGLRPRRLEIPGPARGRHVLRTLDDAQDLAARLRPGARLLIVGASFIGCELASVARSLGCRVSVVAPEQEPMERAVGPELGASMRRRHERNGVSFCLGRVPVAFAGAERVERVLLDDGAVLEVDVVLEAVGCRPETDWLLGNDLDLTDGVLCENSLQVTGHDRVHAVGDIARFPNPLIDGVARRVEHWAMAADTANQVASVITGAGVAGKFCPLPSFWSDQLGLRLQAFGMPSIGDRWEVAAGDLDGEVIVTSWRADQLVGVVGVGLRRELMTWRKALQGALPRAPEPAH
jgi:3-phenylpropionate/trans-cinnamate dioxygenase ferredoxin reductase component